MNVVVVLFLVVVTVAPVDSFAAKTAANEYCREEIGMWERWTSDRDEECEKSYEFRMKVNEFVSNSKSASLTKKQIEYWDALSETDAQNYAFYLSSYERKNLQRFFSEGSGPDPRLHSTSQLALNRWLVNFSIAGDLERFKRARSIGANTTDLKALKATITFNRPSIAKEIVESGALGLSSKDIRDLVGLASINGRDILLEYFLAVFEKEIKRDKGILKSAFYSSLLASPVEKYYGADDYRLPSPYQTGTHKEYWEVRVLLVRKMGYSEKLVAEVIEKMESISRGPVFDSILSTLEIDKPLKPGGRISSQPSSGAADPF